MDFIKRILDKCVRGGAELAEVYNLSQKELNLSVRDSKVETISKSTPGGAAIRFFSGGKSAFAHTTDISNRAIDELISQLSKLAENTTSDKSANLSGPLAKIANLDINSPDYAGVPIDRKIEYLKNLEQMALKYDPLIKQTNGASYKETITTLNLANSNGLDISYDSTLYKIGLSIAATKNDEMFPGEGEYTVRRFNDLPQPEDIVDQTASTAIQLVGGTTVESGDYEIIFTPEGARSILYGLAFALNGEHYLKGSSFLAGKMGEKFADSILNVYDDAAMLRGIASRPFDDEGIASKKLALIENGTLTNVMYDMKTAAKAGTESSASATRKDYFSFPEISYSNFYIEPGKDKIEDVIASCKKGIIVKITQGWGLHSVTGQYSAGINGILVKNGKRIKPVANVTLAAGLDDIFKGIGAICDDLTFFQKLNSPSIMIEKMKIGA